VRIEAFSDRTGERSTGFFMSFDKCPDEGCLEAFHVEQPSVGTDIGGE